MAGDLLTPDEHRALELTAELSAVLSRIIRAGAQEAIAQPHVTREMIAAEADRREVTALIHSIQNAILAQAAARAYPDRYRLLGGVLSRVEMAVPGRCVANRETQAEGSSDPARHDPPPLGR
jgi:hypothetical protein